MMAKINWNIRHVLKDGTELRPGMQFQDTEENRATIERLRDILRHAEGGDTSDRARDE